MIAMIATALTVVVINANANEIATINETVNVKNVAIKE